MIIQKPIDIEQQFRLPEKELTTPNSERDMRDFLSFFINASVPNSNETYQAKGRVFPIYRPLQKSLLGMQSVGIFSKLGGITISPNNEHTDESLLVKPVLSEREYINIALLPIVDSYVKLGITEDVNIEQPNQTDEND